MILCQKQRKRIFEIDSEVYCQMYYEVYCQMYYEVYC